MQTRLATIACAIALLVPAGASARPAPADAAKASVRAEAARLFSLDRFHDKKLDRATSSAVERAQPRFLSCSPGAGDAPNRAQDEAIRRGTSLLLRHALAEAKPDLDRAARAFERFKTSSRTVRDASRAVGRIYRIIGLLAQAPPDLCGYWASWKAANWAEDFRIDPPTRNLTRAEIAAAARAQRTIVRAGRSFRRYGLRRSSVSRFVSTHDVEDVLRQTAL